MTLDPLECTVIGFESNRFNGEIAREIERVVENGSIRVVDILFITKNLDGNVTLVEVDGRDDPRFAGFAPLLDGLRGLLTAEDVDRIAERACPRTRPVWHCSSSIAELNTSRTPSCRPAGSW